MRPYFITGTDTDSGKTYVTRELLRHSLQHQHKAHAIKLVASGCVLVDDGLVSQDDMAYPTLARYTQKQQKNPWRYQLPVSPHIAAKAEGALLSLEALQRYCFQETFSDLTYLFIEGAGGLMAPLTAQHTWVDFLICSRIPVILVVGMRLGCLNHALLTQAVLRHYSISCFGWIANILDDKMLALAENIQTLQQRLVFPWLATIDYGGALPAEFDLGGYCG